MHEYVPEHHLLSAEEADAVLVELNVDRDRLPKIRADDPAVLYLGKVHGSPVKEGSIVKIIRKSMTAGDSVAYRLVING